MEIPVQFLEAQASEVSKNHRGDIDISGYLTKSRQTHFLWYYKDTAGRILFFEVKNMKAASISVLLSTMDGQVVYYNWGEDFYKTCEYGPEANIEVYESWIVVDNKPYILDEVSWEVIQF